MSPSRLGLLLAVALLGACSGSQEHAASEPEAVETSQVEEPEPSAERSTPPLAEARFAYPDDTRRDWPHAPWTHARAYLFNNVAYGPGHGPLYVYRDGVWNESVARTFDLDAEAAASALELTHRLRGEMLVSKCPFPRHAVVFFNASDEPVGSVNVCFSCTDVLVWPAYDPASEDDDEVDAFKCDLAISPEDRKSAQDALSSLREEHPDEASELEWLDVEESGLGAFVHAEAMLAWEAFFGASGLGVPLEPSKSKAIGF